MIIVADTSPLNYLIQIGHIDILERIYGRILIPHAVHDELLAPEAPTAVRQWAQHPPHWLELVSPSRASNDLLSLLDAGEAEAISLAEEMQSGWLLIDERAGAREAFRRGIQTIGTLGIQRAAHYAGWLDLRVSVHQLQAVGFRASASLIAELISSLESK